MLSVGGRQMEPSIEEEVVITPSTVIQNCGPVVLFAHHFPQTMQALRLISGFWHDLDIILFAFSHIRETVVPDAALDDCFDVWNGFRDVDCDVGDYVKKHINDNDIVLKLPFTLRIVLCDAIRTFLLTCIGSPFGHRLLRFDVKAARSGDTCRRMGCVCMLTGNSMFNIETTTLFDVGDLMQTKARLVLPPQQRNKRRRADDDIIVASS